MMMTFTLLPGEECDVPDMVRVFRAAFDPDPIVGRLKCDVPDDCRNEALAQAFSKTFAEKGVYGARFFKVVEEETGQMVAFAEWHYPYHLSEEQRARKTAEDEKPPPSPPAGTNIALWNAFFQQISTKRQKYLDPEHGYHLQILATLPTHHRRGLGSLLLVPGLAAADAAHAPTYIEASTMGLPLYLRHGWCPVDELHIDMDRCGYPGEGTRVEALLMRDPQSPESAYFFPDE